MQSETVDIAGLERSRLDAIVRPDRIVLEALHHPNFVLCTPGGGLWDRTTYIERLCDGSINYSCFEPQSDMDVEISGSLAVVRYLSVIDLLTPTGGGHLECWHLDVYVKGDDSAWRCKWSQATDTLQG